MMGGQSLAIMTITCVKVGKAPPTRASNRDGGRAFHEILVQGNLVQGNSGEVAWNWSECLSVLAGTS